MCADTFYFLINFDKKALHKQGFNNKQHKQSTIKLFFMRKFYDACRRLWVLKIPYCTLTAVAALIFVFVGLGPVNRAAAQTKVTVIGTVVDSLGMPVIGANIAPVNTKGNSTATDGNGKFVLDAAPGTVLKISYVGFVSKEITVSAGQKAIRIVLSETKSQFDDVVVTAYNRKQTREAVVGSLLPLKPGNLKIPASNLTNALAGQVAGVIAYTPAGSLDRITPNFL
jgi:hypothetical protein